ncbi:MAG: phosphatase domain-containing protein [Myxococcota bacterium]
MWLPIVDDEGEQEPLSTKERQRHRARRRKYGSVEMVVPPPDFKIGVSADYVGDAFIWDLDKTYLRSEFSSLRGLIRTALEQGRDKVAYPGATALLKTLRRRDDGSLRPIVFVSASPPQLRAKILDKFALDRVEIDGIYFKDNLRNVRPGRFKRLREQMGYKLMALLDLRSRLPNGAREVTFGDDSENDPAVYALYSEILQKRLGGTRLIRYLEKQGVWPDEATKIAWRARQLPRHPPVRRIFITVHRDLDPRYYRRYGLDVVPTRSAFQAAVALAVRDTISWADLTNVCEEMLQTGSVSARGLTRQLDELASRLSITSAQHEEVRDWLRKVGVS